MAQIHWATAVSGDFQTASDWSGGLVPGAGDNAILDAPGPAFTVIANDTETVNSIQTAANATLDIGFNFTAETGTGTGANAGKIVIGDYGVLTVGGMLTNTGVIAMASDANERPSLLAIRANTTLVGGGMISMTDNIPNANNRVVAVTSGLNTLTNVDNTISGSGQIGSFGADQLILVNEKNGVIDATSSFGLAVEARAGTDVNAGLMEATGYGGLALVTGTFLNTGTIENIGVGAVAISATIDDSRGGILIPGAHMLLAEGVVLGGALTLASGQTILAEGYVNKLATATLANHGTIVIENQSGLNLQNSVNNSGVIALDSTGSYTYLQIGGTGVTLSGGGAVSLGDGANHIFGYQTGAQTLTNIDNTISGAGTIGPPPDGSEVGLVVVNQTRGVIDANDANALTLSTAVITNSGLIEATGSGGLAIQTNVFYGPVVTVNGSGGGVILAGNGSRVALETATLIGGTLTTSGTGLIRVVSGADTLDGTTSAVTNQGTVVIDDGQALTIQGAIHNAGEIGFVGTGDDTSLVIGAAGATLSGGGRLILDNEADNIISGVSSAATLTNVDNVLSGAGQLGAGSLTLINEAQGMIVGSHAAPLVIDTGANTIVNAGRIEAEGTGGVTIRSAVNNSGRLEAAGGVLTVNGAVSGTGAAVIYGGALDFTSSFTQKVAFRTASGVLELGQSQSYTGAVVGFSKTGGTSFDLADIGFVGAGEATFVENGSGTRGVLTVTDGTHTARITLIGDYAGSTFIASSDGRGGTIVVDPPKTDAASPGWIVSAPTHQFVAAMASFGTEAVGASAVAFEPMRPPHPALLAPRAAIA